MANVNFYKMEYIDSFSNDREKNVNIGMMIESLKKDGHGGDLILCGEAEIPIAIKLENTIYDFYTASGNLLKKVPVDSHWYELKDMETVVITGKEISGKRGTTDLPPLLKKRIDQASAKDILKIKAEGLKKDIGIFTTDKGKLAAFMRYCGNRPEIFVAADKYDYLEIIK